MHEPPRVLVGQQVQSVDHRRPAYRLQRETPEVVVAVHDVEALGLAHGAGHVLPLADPPVPGQAVGAVGAGQRGDKVRGWRWRRAASAEHGHLMASLDQTLGEVPDNGLDAAAPEAADGSGEGGDLSYAHVREPTTATQSP